MSRFDLAYNIGENLTPDEIQKIDLKDNELKIKDTTEELPDLLVKDYEAAKKYINYMNRPTDEQKITTLINDIRSILEKLNDLNQSLIHPEKIEIGEDEDGEPIYTTPLKEKLFYTGYLTTVNRYNKDINDKLKEVKRKLLDK